MNPILIGLIGVGTIAVGLSLLALIGAGVFRLMTGTDAVEIDAGDIFCCVFVGGMALLVVALVVILSYEAGHAVLHLWGRI